MRTPSYSSSSLILAPSTDSLCEYNAVFVLNLADRPNCRVQLLRWQKMIRARVDPGPLWAGESGLSTA